MNPALAGVALAVVVGGVFAGSTRDARAAVLGLVVVLVGTAFVAEPLPEPAALGARIVGAVLGGYSLWIAARGHLTQTGGSPVGWPTDAFLAAAAAVVGYGSHGLGAPTAGPAEASAAGFALAALAVLPVVTGGDILRIGLGLGLLLSGALLVRVGLGGTPDALEQLMTAALVGVLGAAVAILAGAARGDGSEGFELASWEERLPHRSDIQPIERR